MSMGFFKAAKLASQLAENEFLSISAATGIISSRTEDAMARINKHHILMQQVNSLSKVERMLYDYRRSKLHAENLGAVSAHFRISNKARFKAGLLIAGMTSVPENARFLRGQKEKLSILQKRVYYDTLVTTYAVLAGKRLVSKLLPVKTR